MAKEKGRITYL